MLISSNMDEDLMIDPKLVRDYTRGFFGYGHLGARYWFVGIEEGGVGDLTDIEKRIRAWNELGRPFLADIRKFHKLLGGIDWFSESPPLQRTWRPLIRTRFAAEGASSDGAALKKYQSAALASAFGDTALLELLPLPARRNTEWFYHLLNLPELSTREYYEAVTTTRRRQQIIRLIDTFQPHTVVTYGDAAAWRQAFDANTPINTKAWTTRRGRTTIVCTHHPEGARSNDHWDAIGRFIRSQA